MKKFLIIGNKWSAEVDSMFRGELRCTAHFEGKRVRFRMEVLDDDRT